MGVMTISAAWSQSPEELRQERDKLIERGLWRDALTLYREKLAPVSDDASGKDLTKAVESISRLREWGQFDELVEATVTAKATNAGVLQAAAAAYQSAMKQGRLIAGEFQRGSDDAGHDRALPVADMDALGGLEVFAGNRDRVRSLQLLLESLKHASTEELRISGWQKIAATLRSSEYWQFQVLTPLGELPDWTESGPSGGTEGVPWIKDGPLLFGVPDSWDAAKNDGERWRFALARLAGFNIALAADSVLERANFSASQFELDRLARYGGWNQDPDDAKALAEIEGLGDDEVLTRTSDGVRRFKLPPEHHFIALFRSIIDTPRVGEQAGDALVRVFLNRRQLTKAREVLEKVIAAHGAGPADSRKQLLAQITGNWGRFEPAATVPEGSRPKIPLVFRNATSVQFTAAPIDMDAVLADTISYLKGNPREVEWERVNPSAIASRIIADDRSKYVGKTEATWEQALKPEEGHRDTMADVEVPVDKAGAWWISAVTKDGNKFHTLVWIVDNVLVQRDVAGQKQWWTADAASGAPIAESNLEFFGYQTVPRDRKTPLDRRMDVLTKSFAGKADQEGRLLVKPGDLDPEYSWMVVARKEGRASAFFGFQPMMIAEPQFENGNRDLTYGISDRPLYKPGDELNLKFFLRNVGYFEPDEGKYASRSGNLTLFNGRGEEVLKIADLRTDEQGAVDAKAVIPGDAVLGGWQAVFSIPDVITASVGFQVEEYRKPEYEVTVEAPVEPIKLGDKFVATVKATYFHGAPVREAQVELIVKRSVIADRWFPLNRWDWLYGKGAWWPGTDTAWHPGSGAWSCEVPPPPWFGRTRWTPEELVMRKTVAIGADGLAKVEVDTADALANHGDMDAQYSIEARVVDASRREERGSGKVIAARKPFEVVLWANRGFTRPGEDVEVTVNASTLAGKAVAGAKGTLKLYKLSVAADGKVEEKETSSWEITTDAEGKAVHKFAAPETGQYRMAAKLALKEGATSEGATILNVHGQGRSEPVDWKFGALELISDKLQYAAGETLKLRVNSDQPDAHVWLFLHIAGSSGREAKRIQLDGKSLEVEVPLDRRDMPNMFIEGVTVHGAKIHSAVKQVLLPPESQLLEVTVEPTKTKVGPREKSSLSITLRDTQGQPFKGKAVLSVYDKSLEAITGGSNVAAIHEQFWNWKNHFYSGRSSCSVPSSPGNLTDRNAKGMQTLGTTFGLRRGGMAASGGVGMRMMEKGAMDMAAPASAAIAADASFGAAQPMAKEQILVRKDFADLLKWVGEVETDAEGKAEVPLEFPDNLTTWKARVWVLGGGTRVGEGSTEIVTSKDLLVRLQAPRFLVERDETTLSAVVHNDHDEPKTVEVSLEIDGDAVQAPETSAKTVEIGARAEARVDWKVKAVHEGVVKLRMRAATAGDGDAVERELPVKVHGMLRQDAWSRVVEPQASSTKIEIDVPAKLRPEETKLTVRISPSVATAVVDAIPYLADYPYGCTEQTLNRFIPAVIAQRTLKGMKIDLADVRKKRTNLNPQELGDPQARAAEWKRWQRNPVFDEAELAKMVKAGTDKLLTMQNSDGGWGWFSGYGERSYPHTTAVVMHGLLAGREAGLTVNDTMYGSGLRWLSAYEKRQVVALQRYEARQKLIKAGKKPKESKLPEKATTDALDALIRETLGKAGQNHEVMTGFLYRDRITLPVYGQALLGLELHRLKDEARRDEVMKVISQFLKRDPENQTAYLDLKNGGYWWSWYGSTIEAHAWYLKLLSAVKPNDPDTRGLVKYLVNNRKGGNYWESTRDTAYVIEAISDYIKASGEDAPSMETEILLDGRSLGKTTINRDNLFSFDGTIMLAGKAVTPGKHVIEVRKVGEGALYANAYLEVFTLEDRLRAAGLEVKVQRKAYKIIESAKENQVPDASGIVINQTEERVKREALEDGAVVSSGDRIEVELILESKNDYEYLIFSDAKAAGFEAINTLSGYTSGPGISAYMEPRDQTVNFFIRSLPRGSHSLRYQLRAETPGVYKALPATANAMYAPELRGNSADLKLGIGE